MSVTSSEHARATQAAADAGPAAEGPASGSPSSGGLARSRVLLPFLVLLATLAAVAHGFAVPLTNTDTYFHLRFGHEFLHGAWSPWHPGSVSTFATAHWVPTQWLSE